VSYLVRQSSSIVIPNSFSLLYGPTCGCSWLAPAMLLQGVVHHTCTGAVSRRRLRLCCASTSAPGSSRVLLEQHPALPTRSEASWRETSEWLQAESQRWAELAGECRAGSCGAHSGELLTSAPALMLLDREQLAARVAFLRRHTVRANLPPFTPLTCRTRTRRRRAAGRLLWPSRSSAGPVR